MRAKLLTRNLIQKRYWHAGPNLRRRSIRYRASACLARMWVGFGFRDQLEP